MVEKASRIDLPITGICSFAKYPICTNLEELSSDFAVLGIPCDLGVGYLSGTRLGPRRIRESSAQYARGARGFYDPEREKTYLASPCRIVDCGDVDIITGDLTRCMENIEESVRLILQKKVIPVCMGGDHSVTIPIGRALGALGRTVDVVQLDAHLDWTNSVGGIQKFGNGSVMRRLSEMGHFNNFTQIGLRGLGSSLTEDFDDARSFGSRLITAKQALSIGIDGVLEHIPASDCCYVTIDIDSFDIPYAPGTGSPVPGGLDYSFITSILEGIAKKCNVIGFDLVEVAPQYDPAGITTRVAALTMLSFIGFIYDNIDNPIKN